MRFGLHTNPDAKGTYIVEYLFIVLSVCKRNVPTIEDKINIINSLALLSQRTTFF